jgi:hypothetical protein
MLITVGATINNPSAFDQDAFQDHPHRQSLSRRFASRDLPLPPSNTRPITPEIRQTLNKCRSTPARRHTLTSVSPASCTHMSGEDLSWRDKYSHIHRCKTKLQDKSSSKSFSDRPLSYDLVWRPCALTTCRKSMQNHRHGVHLGLVLLQLHRLRVGILVVVSIHSKRNADNRVGQPDIGP